MLSGLQLQQVRISAAFCEQGADAGPHHKKGQGKRESADI